jgi:hypothetical protein
MACYGLALTLLYALIVKPGRVNPSPRQPPPLSAFRPPLRSLVSTMSVNCVYIGSGLQLFITGALLAWLPSYLNRFDMPLPAGGSRRSCPCNRSGDAICVRWRIVVRKSPSRKITLAVILPICGSVLARLPASCGHAQLVLIGCHVLRSRDRGLTGTMVST